VKLAELMRKLNQRKIRWICREIEKGEMTVFQIARIQDITPRHARRIYQRFNGVQKPILLRCGRPRKIASQAEIEAILNERGLHPVCAVTIERLLAEKGTFISHNQVHRILKANGLARTEPKKSKRRKWIRYERKHSNSLWHTDWFTLAGKQATAYLDDASRLAVSVRRFDRATIENSMLALADAVSRFGVPKQLITDHGTQYTTMPRVNCRHPEPNAFQTKLRELGIQHIKARVKHPQTNGKVERFVQTIRSLYRQFDDLDASVEYYNYRRPHMSLDNGTLRTPFQAFQDKMPED
jgi:putative transposase